MAPSWLAAGAKMLLVLTLLTLAGGCQAKVGVVESVIRLTTAAGTGGIEADVPSACIWLIGRYGPARGLAMVLAHGDATIERCMELGIPVAVPLLPKSP